MTPAGTTPSRVMLLTRAACHLCESARESLDLVRAATGADWREVNVDTDVELREEYGDQVPVVLLDGQFFAAHVVDADRLIAAVNRLV